MSKFSKFLLAIMMLTLLVFVPQPDTTSAASNSNSTSSYKLYVRGGQYPGGFTFYSKYTELYSYYTSISWKITEQISWNTLSDQYLPVRATDQSTKYSVRGEQRNVLTNFQVCRSYISDPSKYTICREKNSTIFATSNVTSVQHTSNVILPTSYMPQIFTNRISLNY